MRGPGVTPAARLAAAIEVLDVVLQGRGVEAVLSAWGRHNRYAGSGDRSAIRDSVYDALRRRRSLAAWGGGLTGRGLILGAARQSGDPAAVFGVGRYAPPPVRGEEGGEPHGPWPEAVALDCPDFVLPLLHRALGPRTHGVLKLMQSRAETHIRGNLRRTTATGVAERLAAEGIEAEPHPLSPAALTVTEGARRLRRSGAFAEGLFELQDAASQAVADAVPIAHGARILDFCAGAGGKTLAMAARTEAEWFAHDADAARMVDLPERASRAGCRVTILPARTASQAAPFDVVVVDAPCSGSGAWRRDPEAKWSLTPARLDDLRRQQAEILDEAAELVAPDGTLAYATCSLLLEENDWQVASFCRRNGWSVAGSLRLTPLEGGDGFYLALLAR